jgi:hypothetical protein
LVIRISYGYGIASSIHKIRDFFHVGSQAPPKLSVFLQSSLIGGRLLWSLLALILLKNSQFSLKDFQNSIDIHCRHFSILQGRDAFKGGVAGERRQRTRPGADDAQDDQR